jgi:predicted transcriptional regulator
MSQLALQAQSMMDHREIGGRLRFSRSTFENFTAFVFPLTGRQTLVVAVDSKNLVSGAIAKVVQLLKSLDEESPIDQKEIRDGLFPIGRSASVVGSQSSSLSSTSSSSTSSSAVDSSPSPGVSSASPQWSESTSTDSEGHSPRADFATSAMLRRRRPRVVRSQTMIVRAILEACRSPSAQHWIMIKAKLGYETFWMHIKTLLAQGLLKEEKDGHRLLYSITESGLACLRQLPQD